MRDCNKCIHHISGSCSAWECEMQTLEDYRNKVIDEFAERIALEISESIIWGMLPTDCKDGVSDEIVDYVIDTSKKIAEQMRKEV